MANQEGRIWHLSPSQAVTPSWKPHSPVASFSGINCPIPKIKLVSHGQNKLEVLTWPPECLQAPLVHSQQSVFAALLKYLGGFRKWFAFEKARVGTVSKVAAELAHQRCAGVRKHPPPGPIWSALINQPDIDERTYISDTTPHTTCTI